MILTFNPLGPMQKKEKENLLDLFIYVNLVNLEIYMTTIQMQQMFYSNIQWKLQNSLLLWPIYRPVQKKNLYWFSVRFYADSIDTRCAYVYVWMCLTGSGHTIYVLDHNNRHWLASTSI